MLSWDATDRVVTFTDFKKKVETVAGGLHHQNQKFYKGKLVGRYRMFKEWKLRTWRNGELAQEDSQEFELPSPMDVYFSEVAAESPLLTDGATASTSGEVQPSKRRRGDSQPQPQPQQLQQMISDPVVEIPRLSASVPLGTMLSGSGGQMGGVLPEMAFQRIRAAPQQMMMQQEMDRQQQQQRQQQQPQHQTRQRRQKHMRDTQAPESPPRLNYEYNEPVRTTTMEALLLPVLSDQAILSTILPNCFPSDAPPAAPAAAAPPPTEEDPSHQMAPDADSDSDTEQSDNDDDDEGWTSVATEEKGGVDQTEAAGATPAAGRLGAEATDPEENQHTHASQADVCADGPASPGTASEDEGDDDIEVSSQPSSQRQIVSLTHDDD